MPDGSRHPVDELAALSGSFADFKLIKSRSVAQLIVELPIEEADRALRILGGIPQPGKEAPVALARLQAPATSEPPAAATRPRDAAPPGKPDLDRSRRSREAYRNQTEEERAVTDAAIFCQDKAHQAEMLRRHPLAWMRRAAPDMKPEEIMSACLCELLDITRKRDLVSNPEARTIFYEIRDSFDRAANRIPEPR